MDADSCVRVAVRVRPTAHPGREDVCATCQDNQVTIFNGDTVVYSASYDHVYDQDSGQAVIFQDLAVPLLECFFAGYNATILAYGQTGSGKTFTMGTSDNTGVGVADLGIIPRAIGQVFETVDQRQAEMSITVKASFLEIYNEEVRDLLVESMDPDAGRNIMIRENVDGSIVVNGLTERVVSSTEDTLQCLQYGAQFRSTGSTLMNAVSSRSHAIFTLSLEQRFPPPTGSNVEEIRLSKFHFVDLAGSERQKRTKAVGERLKEGISINCGLLALGNVISVLGDPMKKGSHVPYRDSRLTRMLQDSLGGNSKTVFISCVSPAAVDMDEGKNSLRYANRARNIQNKAVINLDTASSEIVALRHRIAHLEAILAQHGIDVPLGMDEGRQGSGSGARPSPYSSGGSRSRSPGDSRRPNSRDVLQPGIALAWSDPSGNSVPAPLSLTPELEQSIDTIDNGNLEPPVVSLPPFDQGGSRSCRDDPFGIHIDADESMDGSDVGDELLDEEMLSDLQVEAPKLTAQLHVLESKLQCLETERHAAESRLHMSRKERESEAQQHALRVAVLEKEIAMVTQEMVRITTSASKKENSKDEQSNRVKLELDEKLSKMKQELMELRLAYKETQKKLTVQRGSTERIQNLQSAIAGIKEEKAKLLRRMREDSNRSREKTEQERRNNAHLQKSLSRKTWEVTKLKAEKDRQELILERKKEEVQLSKQKLVELQNKMQRSDEMYRPRSASAVTASFVSSLRNGSASQSSRAGNTQRKQQRLRQQKLRQLGKRLVSTASRRWGLEETVARERAARDGAVRNLEILYEQQEDDVTQPALDLSIVAFEEEIDAKNQTIAAMHDAMNDEDLSDATQLLAALPIEDYGDLISILVDIAAKCAPSGEILDDSIEFFAMPKKLGRKQQTARPSSEPRTRRPSCRWSNAGSRGSVEDQSAVVADLHAADDSGTGGVAALGTAPDEPEPEVADDDMIATSKVFVPKSRSPVKSRSPGKNHPRGRSPPIQSIPLPARTSPSQFRLSGGASGTAKGASSQHSVFDRLSDAGERPKPVSHRDGIYVAATRREKVKSLASCDSRKSFAFQTTLVGHRGAVYDAACNDASTKVYSASQDTTCLEWDVETSQVTAVCEGHQGFVRAVVVANGEFGQLLISGAQDSCIKLWDMRAPQTSRCVATLTDHTSEVCFLSVVGDKLFSGSADATVKYWDIRHPRCVDTLRGHKSTVFAVAAASTSDGAAPCMYFTGSRDHTIKVWDANFRCRQTIQAHTDSVTSLVVCGEHLFSSSRENRIKWHVDLNDPEGVPVTKVKSFRAHNDWVCAMSLQEDKSLPALLSASRDGSVRVWDSTECTHLGTLTGHSSSVNSVVSHPGGKLTLTASSDRTVKVWTSLKK